MYAVCVNFEIKTGHMDDFLPRMRANARLSLETEAGCHQFDVLTDPDQPDDVFLYELYTDRAAFDLHLESAHFQAFNSETADMIAAKSVKTWGVVAQ